MNASPEPPGRFWSLWKRAFAKGLRLLLDGTGRILFRILPLFWEPLCWMHRRRRCRSLEGVRRILFVALDNPGDVLLITPCLTALKERFPQAKIACLAGEWSRDLLTTHPAVSGLIFYNASWFSSYVKHLNPSPFPPVRDLFRCLRDLWKGEFDLVVETRGEAAHVLLAYLSGAPYRCGYAIRSNLAWLTPNAVAHLLTHPVAYPWEKWFTWHRVESNLQVIAALGAVPTDSSLVLTLSDSDRRFAGRFLQRHGVREEELLIGAHPGARVERRRWPCSRFAQVLDALAIRWNARIVVLGGAGEEDLALELAQRMVAAPVLAVGKTTLLEAGALIERCRLVICNDSVMTHLASAVKRPAVSISRAPENFVAPYGTEGVALTRRLPCMNRSFPDRCRCPFSEYRCLQAVTPEEVIRAAEEILENRH